MFIFSLFLPSTILNFFWFDVSRWFVEIGSLKSTGGASARAFARFAWAEIFVVAAFVWRRAVICGNRDRAAWFVSWAAIAERNSPEQILDFLRFKDTPHERIPIHPDGDCSIHVSDVQFQSVFECSVSLFFGVFSVVYLGAAELLKRFFVHCVVLAYMNWIH